MINWNLTGFNKVVNTIYVDTYTFVRQTQKPFKMKKFLLASLAIVFTTVTVLAGGDLKSAKTEYKIDAATSKIKWVGKKVTGEHTGYVSFKSGSVNYSDNKITDATAVVDMTSITCSDMEPGAGGDKLVGHLKAVDFFDVSKFGTSEFKMVSLTKIEGAKEGENNYKVKGTLTIKGITNAIEFPARVEVKDKTLVLRADVTFDRTKYDIKFGSASVIEGIGNRAISDEVLFSLALVARAE